MPGKTIAGGVASCTLYMQTFISKEHEKQAYGIGSPGPGTAKPYTSSGSQQLSTKHTNPTWGFGTSKVNQQFVGTAITMPFVAAFAFGAMLNLLSTPGMPLGPMSASAVLALVQHKTCAVRNLSF